MVAGREDGLVQRTILVVDDDQSVRTIVSMALELEGYAVLTAGDVEQGFAAGAAHDATIDLLVVDLTLEGGGASALVERLAASGRSLPVLFVSGYPDPSDLPAGEPCLFLAKPFTPEELAAAVEQLLAG